MGLRQIDILLYFLCHIYIARYSQVKNLNASWNLTIDIFHSLIGQVKHFTSMLISRDCDYCSSTMYLAKYIVVLTFDIQCKIDV